MNSYETFGQCLQRVLHEMKLSASEVARLVKFRSRNSIFRILGDDTGYEVNARFLTALEEAVGSAWPEKTWAELREALAVMQVGPQRYASNRAFFRTLHGVDEETSFVAVLGDTEVPLQRLLTDLLSGPKMEMVITGCCDASLSRLLVRCCAGAGAEERLTIRHYIDVGEQVVVQNLLGALPLISRSWYNARLVDHQTCPAEMLDLYRVNLIMLRQVDGRGVTHHLLRYDASHFFYRQEPEEMTSLIPLLDRWRYRLEILKPMNASQGGTEAFVQYTADFADLEKDCTILSIKPDIHFNCVPRYIHEQAITEGFAEAGIAVGEDLAQLMGRLTAIHDARFGNMISKRSATHLVYSLPAMERFVATGVQSDQFFIQRPYTPAERRAVLAVLRDAMLRRPYFNVHFLNAQSPALCNEITLYKGKGVLLMDAFSDYALNDDHSEAVITLPAFMDSFYRFFMDELLQKHVMSRAESLAALEKLMASCG